MNIRYNFINKLTHIYTNIYIFKKYNKSHRINIIKINLYINIYESE